MANSSAKDFMSTELISISENEQLSSFENYFKRRNIHHLLVENLQGKLVGIISSEDVAKSKSWIVKDKVIASDIMTKDPTTIVTDTPIIDVKSIFLENRYRALPVMNDMDKLVGIITPFDLIAKM